MNIPFLDLSRMDENLGALGEAGMCLTQDLYLAQQIRMLLNHGQTIRDQHELVGRNSRIDTIQAAFLNALLEDFAASQQMRKAVAGQYLDSFSRIESMRLPNGILESDHNAHLFVIKTERRDELKSFLGAKGIRPAIHYPMILPDMKPFQCEGHFYNARNLAKCGLSIPLNPYLKEEEVGFIIELILKFFVRW